MIRAIEYTALGTGFTFLMTALGASMVFFVSKHRATRTNKILLGFAAGVMTAASVWSLLLPGIEQSEKNGDLPPWLPASVGFLAGVVFLTVLDALTPKILRISKENEDKRSSALLISAITLHNIPEGMAVGLAFALANTEESLYCASALALGIGIQNFPEGAAISMPLVQSGDSRIKAFVKGMLSGIVEPVFGILIVFAVNDGQYVMPWLLSFAAGAMLYVVVEELVPEARSKGGTCGFVGGFLIMMILDVALG